MGRGRRRRLRQAAEAHPTTRQMEIKKLLTAIPRLCYNRFNNIRKALTERVVRDESSRESGTLVEVTYEDNERKPFLSCNAEYQ